MSDYKNKGLYHKRLDNEEEAVISDHFIYKIVKTDKVKLYNQEKFLQKALYIDTKFLKELLIPYMQSASNAFIKKRVDAAMNRAKTNYLNYGRSSPEALQASDMITEAMFDRHFLRGPKYYSNRKYVSKLVNKRIEERQIVEMVIVALPFKSNSRLKCRGILPDLSEIDFLLSLYELTEIVSRIYKRVCDIDFDVCAKFIIISDGFRFNQIVNYDEKEIDAYQSKLADWIQTLGLASHIEIKDYQTLFQDKLPGMLLEQKKHIKNQSIKLYRKTIGNITDYSDLEDAVAYLIANESEPEYSHPEGRFFPLFKSLLFSMKFKAIQTYCLQHDLSYQSVYLSMISQIFTPFYNSKDKEKEALRLAMLEETWQAAIQYISEIKSDRDLEEDPIITCIPEAIRWTIHPKPGQLALLIPTTQGDQVLPWHGTSMFKYVNREKIRQYTLPTVAIESMNARPVLIKENNIPQPFFYIDEKITGLQELKCLLEQHLTRIRKS